MKSKQTYFLILLAVVALAGCMVGKQYTKPAPQEGIVFPNATATDTSKLARWFEVYHDAELQNIIKITLDSNRDFMTAAARIEEARAQTGAIKANLYPHFGYQAQAGGGSAGTDATKVSGGIQGGLLNVFGVLNWELDIWGKLRRSTRAAVNDMLASVANRDALQVSLVAEAASDYFLLRDLDNRLLIAQNTLIARKESTSIISERFEKGYVAELDKLWAVSQEAIAAVAVPEFKRQIVQTENALRVLMGLGPGPINRGASNYDQQLSPDIPVGLPSKLLERRPDVVASEYALQAQFERIGVAQANMFPTISLTGLLGFASPQLSTLISSKGFVANGFGGLMGPLFNFNQNKKLVEVARRQTEQLYYQYQQTALNAFADVDNALAAYRSFNEEYEQAKILAGAAAKALKLSEARYNNGFTSYLEVLIQETNLFDAQIQESTILQQKLNAIVSLYKALGGGWDMPN
jgi:outer membrane protein, multidrug efflux system